ncbi:MAG: DUF4411 family protein [Methylotenera sp.]|nr:DUF4411 family protein [Methylotenera sp.]
MTGNLVGNERYLFDTNILINAKNNYYHPDIVPAFWQWVMDGHKQGCFYSIDKVSNELKKGDETDYLQQFALNHQSMFLSSNDISCIAEYAKLQTWVNTVWTQKKNLNKTSKAIEVFASETNADAFLVAYAKAHSFIIVTNETSDLQCQTNVKIPDAANYCGVEVINLYQLLLAHSHNNFQFK